VNFGETTVVCEDLFEKGCESLLSKASVLLKLIWWSVCGDGSYFLVFKKADVQLDASSGISIRLRAYLMCQ
jgi:hypothetical protein